jgi:pyruvate/2-oxoacid:ferredoxin oxidoreductase alpha subunit
MADLTLLAFELADKYRTPVYILSDAYTGQMMEPVEFPETVAPFERKPWAVYADKESRPNLITSIKMNPVEMENVNIQLQETYKKIEETEVRYREYDVEDAEHLIIAYGISGRIAQSTVKTLRSQGLKVGLLRPLTLMPFPKKRLYELAQKVKVMTVFELSNGQMLDDVKLAVREKCPVEFFNRMGGAVPTSEELRGAIANIHKKHMG